MRPRTIAVGDIHGCARALDALLAAVGPGPGDVVVTLGDYVNRGPDSRGVLDRLIDLGHRCRLVPILGNHDQVLRDARAGKASIVTLVGMGGLATLDSYGPDRDVFRVPDVHLTFLNECHDFHETETHLFTHANYLEGLPMAGQPAGALRWDSLRERTPGPHVSGKTAVVGHSSQKSGEVLDLGYLKCIDTFCHGGGWLTALDVDTGELWQADREGRLRGR